MQGVPSDSELEELAEQLERRWDQATWRRYGAALSRRGDPLGALITAELDEQPDLRGWADWLEAHLEEWIGPRCAAWSREDAPAGMGQRWELGLEWRLGHLRSATMSLGLRRGEAGELIEELLESPAARFLPALTISGATAEAIRRLGARRLPALRELTLGVHPEDLREELTDPLGPFIEELEPPGALAPILEAAPELRDSSRSSW